MAKWKSNDAAGRRWKDGPKCLTPDQTLFPGATTTSFRLDDFLLLMGDQQPETVAYLTRGFQEGSKIHIDEEYLADYETTIFQNGKNPSPERLTKPSPKPFERTANSVTPRHARPCGEPCTWLHLCEQNPRKMVAWRSPANLGQFKTCRKQARENGQ